MFDVGGGELLFILLVILLLFGPKKIPEFAQQVGRGIRQFRRAQEDLTQQIRDISAEAAITEQRITVKPPEAPSTPRTDPQKSELSLEGADLGSAEPEKADDDSATTTNEDPQRTPDL